MKASPSKLNIPSIFQKSPISNVAQEKTSVTRKTSSVEGPLKQETASSISKSTGSLFKRAENNQAPVKQTSITKSASNIFAEANKNRTETSDTDLQRKTSLVRKSNPSLSVAASPTLFKKDAALEVQQKNSSGHRSVSALSVAGNTVDPKKNDVPEFQQKLSSGLKPISFPFSISANSVDPKKSDTSNKKSENTSLKSSFSKSVSNLSTERTSADSKMTPESPSTKFNFTAKSTSNLAPNNTLSSNTTSEKKSTSPTVVSSVKKSTENLSQTTKPKEEESSDKFTIPSLPSIKTLAAQFSSTPIKKEIKNDESYQRNLSPSPSINRSFSTQTSITSKSGKDEKLSSPLDGKTEILPSSPFNKSFSKQNSVSSNVDQEVKSPIPFQIKSLASPQSPFNKSFPKQNFTFSNRDQEEKSPKIFSINSPTNNTSISPTNANISGLSVPSTPKDQEKDSDIILRRNLKSPQSADRSSTMCFNFVKKNSTSTTETNKSPMKRETVELFEEKSSLKVAGNRIGLHLDNGQGNRDEIKPKGKITESENTNDIKMDTHDEIKKSSAKLSEYESLTKDKMNVNKDIVKSKEETPEIKKIQNIKINTDKESIITDIKNLNQDYENKTIVTDNQVQSQEEITVTKKRSRAQTEICDEILNTIATQLNHEENKENSAVNQSVSVAKSENVNQYCDDEKIYENIDIIRQHIAKKSRSDVPVGKCPVPSVRINYLKLRRRTVFF